MAVAEVLTLAESRIGCEYGWQTPRPSLAEWDERTLRLRLGLIAHAWVVQSRGKVRGDDLPLPVCPGRTRWQLDVVFLQPKFICSHESRVEANGRPLD